MWRYVVRRILWMIPVILGVTFIVFTLLKLAPGNPAITVLGPNATPGDVAVWNAAHGLDKPFIIQFLNYLKNIFLHFDFGKTFVGSRPVSADIASRLPKSLIMAFLAIGVTNIVGIPIGIMSAVHQYSWRDNIFMVLALLLISMPTFWLGLELSVLFALKLQWLPATGFYGVKYAILPVLTLSLAGVANSIRMTRSCVLDVISQDYIVTAKAKGVSQRMIVYKHALKNAIIPIITQMGMGACALLGGAMVTEIVFSIPGMGTFMVNGINARDYPIILGSVVVLSFVACAILLVTDLAYAAFDPRIRAQYKSKSIRSAMRKEFRENG